MSRHSGGLVFGWVAVVAAVVAGTGPAPATAAPATATATSAAATAPAANPAVLFCSPLGPTGGWVDLTDLAELRAKGFEVDYTETLDDLATRMDPTALQGIATGQQL